MDVLTLRIKKVYFDAIAKGEKTHEFRACKDFYRKRLEKNPRFLLLHYQKQQRLLCEILSVKIIDKPDYLSSDLIDTPQCYCIALKPLYEYMKDNS